MEAAVKSASNETGSLEASLIKAGKSFSLFAALGSAIFGLAVTAGWALDLDQLKRPLPGSMIHSSVALCLVLAAIAFLLVSRPQKHARIAGRVLATLVAASGALTFFEDLSGWDLGLNHTCWQTNQDSAGLTFPGPIAPNVALAFVLLGLSILTFPWKIKGGRYPFQYLAVSCLALSAMALIGHAAGVDYLCTLVGCIKMPLATSFALFILPLAVLLAEPELGLTEVFVRDTTGGRITRRFACLVMIMPAGLWLNRTGMQAGLYDAAFGWATFAVGTIVFAIAAIAWNAKTLDDIEHARTDAEMRLEKLSKAPESAPGEVRRLKFRTVCPDCEIDAPHDLFFCTECGRPLTRVTEDPLVGSVFADRYQIEALLGMGGMSSVYRAKHIGLDVMVAIKLMHAHMASNVDYVKRFQREAKAASQVQHRNVISVRDFGFSADGEPYLVMDLLEGDSLAFQLEGRALPVKRMLPIFIQVCDGLAEAHLHEVIHRDLKPGNIMLVSQPDGSERAIVVDFGLAKALSMETSTKLTKTGSIYGTPHYMSPEQCLGVEIDCLTDIYSLGCLMYECMVGAPPFDSDSELKVVQMQVMKEPPPIPAYLAIPEWLEQVVMSCLKKDKSLRPQSMRELRNRLLAKAL